VSPLRTGDFFGFRPGARFVVFFVLAIHRIEDSEGNIIAKNGAGRKTVQAGERPFLDREKDFAYNIGSMFITFEGIDFSGKSTQAGLAASRLESLGRKVRLLREPGGTGLSERIRALLLDRDNVPIDPLSELMLFSAARAQLVQEVILPALREGTIVVCDRFYDSTTAYQGYGRNLPLDEIRSLNRFSTAGTTPDLTLFVDVEPAEIKQRKIRAGQTPDRMEQSGDVFFRKVAEGYRRIARDEPERVVVIGGMGTIEETHADIWKHVERILSGTRSAS